MHVQKMLKIRKVIRETEITNRKTPLLLTLFFMVFSMLLSTNDTYATSTRYQITAPNAPVGATSICQGAATAAYTNQSVSTNCSVTGTDVTNTITYQWVYDGTNNIPGASGTFVVGSGTPPLVTLTAAQSAVLATLSLGSHTLQCRYTPNQTQCSGTSGVGIMSPALTITVAGAGAVTVSGGGTACGSLSLTASGGSGGTIYYQGTTSNGTSTASASTSQTITTSGTYYFRARTSGGCWGTQGSASVTINTAPGATTVSGGGSYCSSTTITASGGSGGTIYYQGTTSGGTSTATAATSMSITSSGTYYFRSRSAAGCWGPQGSVSVTINPLPAAIGGTAALCVGASTTLTNATTGGTWHSAHTAVATIGLTTGVANCATAGTAAITYTTTAGCTATRIITSNPNPATITGVAAICVGESAMLEQTTPGGTWSSSASGITTVSSTGEITGVSSGTADISYTLATGCRSVKSITTNPLPAPINGLAYICEGASSTLSSTTTGGTWLSTDVSKATIESTTGVVAAILEGTATISYTLPTGCVATRIVTIAASPANIDGTATVCEGLTTTLSNSVPSGTWSSGATSVANIDASGVVNGINAGTASITYTLSNTCSTVSTITVHPTPTSITGTPDVCLNAITLLSNSLTGGSWSSSNTTVATISTGGEVTGNALGTADITYIMPTGCLNTRTITVNPLPNYITGTGTVCSGHTTSLSSTTTGGNWSSISPTVATIDGAGVVTGESGGTAEIHYTLSTGCMVTSIVTVHTTPAAITGVNEVCAGSTTTMSNTHSGGDWSCSNTTIAAIDFLSGEVTAISDGTTTISYIQPTGCLATHTLSVNALPADISGAATVCVDKSTTLTNATHGGNWVSADNSIATIDAAGVATGHNEGAVTISYQLPTGCIKTHLLTVNPLPQNITGTTEVCIGETTNLNNATPDGTWSSSSTAIAGISSTGVVSGLLSGTTTISYTLLTGCYKTTTTTVNPLPDNITGTMQVCENSAVTLSSTSIGGFWQTENAAIATVDVAGTVTGVLAGTTLITYTIPTGCRTTTTVTVNAVPVNTTGNPAVCEGLTTMLGNTMTGGTWSGGNLSIATISPAGLVSAIAAGNTTVTYTLPTGCSATTEVTVNALPANITGAATVCVNSNTTLTSTTPSGTWSSSNTGVAIINTTGDVTGITNGTAHITYTLSTGCISTKDITVNPLPESITGNMNICEGASSNLNNLTDGGTWSVSNTAVATISPTGTLTGVANGFSVVSYSLPTGCYRVATAIVNPTPTTIEGTTSICAGQSTTLSNSLAGGIWSSESAVAAINSTGTLSGIAAGTTRISYRMGTGCASTVVVTVNSLPALILGSSEICIGSNTTLTNAATAGAWTSTDGSVLAINSATGQITGVTSGTVTVRYTLSTGCSRTKSITVLPLPAAITGSDEVCAGSSVALTSADAGGSWTVGTAGVATINSTGNLTGLIAGTTAVTYRLPSGCMTSRNITVHTLPHTITGMAGVCMGAATTLTNATAGGTWWSNDPLITDIDVTSGLMTGYASGSTIVSYMLPTGCYRTRSVTVYALPEAYTVTGGGNYCAGGTGVSVGLSNSQTGTNYQLYKGTTFVSSILGTGSTINFGLHTAADMYTVKATSSLGCVNNMTSDATVSITPLVTPAISISKDVADTICDGIPATFTASITNGGSAPVYIWRINGVTSGSSSTLSYTPANGDVIAATLISNETCISSGSANAATSLTVLTNVMPTLHIAATPGNSVCEGDVITFSSTITNGGTMPAYSWVVNGSTVAGATSSSFSYTPVHSDNVFCKLNSNYQCLLNNDIESSKTNIKVSKIYIPSVSVSSDKGNMVNSGQLVTFIATIANAGTIPTYQWQINGTDIPGEVMATYKTTSLKNGDVVTCQVTGEGACGMVSINSIAMTVDETTSVNSYSISAGSIKLTPNPNSGIFSIEGKANTAITNQLNVRITNMLGQVVYSENLQICNGTINEQIFLPGDLANGMYLLNLSAASQQETIHFVIRK